jgi:hypothetical protein
MTYVYAVWAICDTEVRATCSTKEKALELAIKLCEKDGLELHTDVMIVQLPMDELYDMNDMQYSILDGSHFNLN